MKARPPKQLSFGLTPARSCPCGKERQRHRLLCPECWALAPSSMKTEFFLGHREAARELITWAKEHRHFPASSL